MPQPARRGYNIPPGVAPVSPGPAHQAMEARLHRISDEQGAKPTADNTLLRGSMAGSCTRNVAFSMLEVEPTNRTNTDSLIAFFVGNRYHEEIQAALVEQFTAAVEVTATYRSIGADISGSADAVYGVDDRTVVEIKSMKAFAFDMAINGNRYDLVGPGPKKNHLQQAGIYAMAPNIQADRVHMIYVCKDTGQIAEWIFGLDETIDYLGFATTVRILAREELARLLQVREEVVAGNLPARVVPDYGLVTHRPPEADSKHKPWMCRYCAYRDICAELPYQAFPLEVKGWKVRNPEQSSPAPLS